MNGYWHEYERIGPKDLYAYFGIEKKKDDERKRLLEAQYAQGVKARIDVGVPKVDERGFQANVRDKC